MKKGIVRAQQNYPIVIAAILAVVAVIYIIWQGAVPGILLGFLLS